MTIKTIHGKLKPNMRENKDKVKIFQLKLGKFGGICFQQILYTRGNWSTKEEFPNLKKKKCRPDKITTKFFQNLREELLTVMLLKSFVK